MQPSAQPWLGSSKIGAKDQPPITFNAVTAAAQRDRLVLDSATTDVILKMERFPLLFLPVTPKSAPVIFFQQFRQSPYGIGVCC
jgi:hypothetical protein